MLHLLGWYMHIGRQTELDRHIKAYSCNFADFLFQLINRVARIIFLLLLHPDKFVQTKCRIKPICN